MEKDDQKPESVTPDALKAGENIDKGRRKFTKAGSVAAAVLMTVANRPTMAGGSWWDGGGTTKTGKNDKQCRMSAWMSAGSGPSITKCGGHGTKYWCDKYNKKDSYCWPRPHLSSGGCDGTGYPNKWQGWEYKTDCTPTYRSICGSYPHDTVYTQGYWGQKQKISNPSLCDVLKDDRYGTKLQSQFCAALLNAADGDCNYGYTVMEVVKIYQDNIGKPTELYNFFKTLNSRS